MEREGRSKRRTQTDFLARRRQSGKAMQRENPSQSLIRKGEEEEIVKGDDRNDGNDEVDEEMEEAEEDEESCATPRCVPRRPRRTSQGATRRVQRVVKLVGPGRSHMKHTSSASSQRSEAFMTHLPDSPPRGRSSIFQFAETRLKTPLEATVAASHIVNEQKGEDVSIETEKFKEQEDDTLEETEENPEVDESQEDTTKGVEDDEETNELSCGGPHAIDLSPPPLGLEEDDTSEDEEETEEETEEKEEEEYRHLQEAHARFEAGQTERNALRQELEAYVASLPTRCDTEGDKLVEFPRNFQQIVLLMTAQDIVSDEIPTTPKAGNDHKSWSQVLIQNSLAKQQAFGTLDESEDTTDGEGSLTAKIALKIARIRQLDAVLEEKLGKNLYAAPTITLKKAKHVNPQEPEVILGIAGSAVRRSPLARDAGPTSRSSSSLLMGSTPSGLKAMNHVERNRKIVENGGKANLTRDEEYRVKRLLRESKQKEVTAEDTSDVPTVTEFRLEQQQQDEIEKLIAEKRGLYPSAIIMALNDVTEEEEVVDDPVRNKKDQRKANVVQETKRERLRQQRLQRIEEELKFLHDNENVPILPDDDDDPSDGCSSERSFMTTTSMLSTTSTRSGVTRRQLDQFVASEVTKADHTKASREEIQQLLRSLAHLPLPTSRPVTTATV